MPCLLLSDASLVFGHVALLDHADFQLDHGEQVALIGRNGSGKSSLLAALAGQRGLNDGQLWRGPGLRIAYVPQEPPFDEQLTVFAAVVAGMGEVSTLLTEYHDQSAAPGGRWRHSSGCLADQERRCPGPAGLEWGGQGGIPDRLPTPGLADAHGRLHADCSSLADR